MLRCIITLNDLAQKAVSEAEAEARATFSTIKATMGPLIHRVTQLKFLNPREPKAVFAKVCEDLCDELKASFDALGE